MDRQMDILRDDPKRIAQAYRIAAESELMNPHFKMAERQERHDYYMAQAEQLERRA